VKTNFTLLNRTGFVGLSYISVFVILILFYFVQADTYVCPQCQAPKKRFAKYDANTGRAIGGGLPPIGVIVGLVAGVGAVGALLLYGLQ